MENLWKVYSLIFDKFCIATVHVTFPSSVIKVEAIDGLCNYAQNVLLFFKWTQKERLVAVLGKRISTASEDCVDDWMLEIALSSIVHLIQSDVYIYDTKPEGTCIGKHTTSTQHPFPLHSATAINATLHPVVCTCGPNSPHFSINVAEI